MGVTFQTDQTGANSNVCSTTSQAFNFSLAQSAIVDSASFVIKKGSGTTASIVASIYNAANGGGSLVESVTVLASSISQTFETITFTFSGNITLDAGISYSLVVSSSTSCSGSSPYSMKSGNFQVLNGNTVINTGYGVSADILNVTSITSDANASLKISSSASVSSTVSASSLFSVSISSSINNITSFISQAIKSKPNNPNKIRLDSHGNIQALKIYIGNKIPKIYRGNSIISNQN